MGTGRKMISKDEDQNSDSLPPRRMSSDDDQMVNTIGTERGAPITTRGGPNSN